jgi:hypothetical protein
LTELYGWYAIFKASGPRTELGSYRRKEMAEKRDALSRQGRRFLEVSTVSRRYFLQGVVAKRPRYHFMMKAQ